MVRDPTHCQLNDAVSVCAIRGQRLLLHHPGRTLRERCRIAAQNTAPAEPTRSRSYIRRVSPPRSLLSLTRFATSLPTRRDTRSGAVFLRHGRTSP
jgi:hypothetical protein